MIHIINAIKSVITIVAPTGVDARIEVKIPTTVQITEITADKITTPLKLLNSLIAESAGKIINADIKSDPTRFIASTIIIAVTTAISVLYLPAPIPVAFI